MLGQGLVDGSASAQPGDLGPLRFRQPAGTAPGWVIFYDASSDGSNGILQATMVRVQFAAATPAPRILEVTTSPRLRTLEGGFWLELPQGEGKVVFSVKATNAQRVQFVLTPTGTDVGPYARLLGEDRTPADGFTLLWRYPAEGLSAHLGIQAVGWAAPTARRSASPTNPPTATGATTSQWRRSPGGHRARILTPQPHGRLCLSSRLGLAVVASLFVAEHDSPDVIGDPALEAAHGFPGGLALGEFAPEVVVAGAAPVPTWTRAMRCRAWLSCRSPARDRRCRVRSPLATSTGPLRCSWRSAPLWGTATPVRCGQAAGQR